MTKERRAELRRRALVECSDILSSAIDAGVASSSAQFEDLDEEEQLFVERRMKHEIDLLEKKIARLPYPPLPT